MKQHGLLWLYLGLFFIAKAVEATISDNEIDDGFYKHHLQPKSPAIELPGNYVYM